MKIIIAVLAFGVIIAVHEWGHYIAARLCSITVREFALGMGPALYKRRWKNGTLFSIRLFPIGGYCQMLGEDESVDDEHSFSNRPIYMRAITLVAGATMNLLLGFVLVMIGVIAGKTFATTTIAEFSQDASSSASGLMLDDEIKKVNGMTIFTASDLIYQLRSDEDGVVDMVVVREGKKITLDNVKFELVTEDGNDKPTLLLDFKVYGKKVSVTNVIPQSFGKSVSSVRLIWMSIIDTLKGKYGINDLSGPVGIVSAIGEAAKYGVGDVIYLLSLIAMNVGIFNLLPLPALDGGRIVFLLIEAIRRKPMNPEHEGLVHFVGLALFMLLALIVTFKDIKEIIVNLI